jgi:phenylacetate-CoA ligase
VQAAAVPTGAHLAPAARRGYDPRVTFALRTPDGTAWPRLPLPQVAQVWAAYQELDHTQWLPSAQIEEMQLVQLQALLSHCARQVPYYRRVLAEAGLADSPLQSLSDLRRVPLMTRRLYQENAADLMAQRLPPEMVQTGSSFTSGTNGVPIQVHRTDRDGVWWNALFLRDLEWSDIDPRGRLASIRLLTTKKEELPRALEGGSSPWWTRVSGMLLETGPSHAMDIRQDPRRQLEWLRGVKPDYLLSMPSNLEFLAGLVIESGEPLPGLRAIQSIGEPLSEDARERIEAGFGAPVKNLYSATEAGYIASPCPLGHGMHLHAESVLAEVLDADDRPCLPGQTGRLVLTSLHSFLNPFIRYDIMDEVTLAPGPCPCGRGLPLWTAVNGRRHPLLHLLDGGRKTSLGITLGLRRVGGVHQFQAVQKSVDRVVVYAVPDRSWRDDTAERMRQAVRDELGQEVRVDVETRERIERPSGGKLRVVVSDLEDR